VQESTDPVNFGQYTNCNNNRKDELLFVCLTIESLWVDDCDVSTAILLVFIRQWGRLFLSLFVEFEEQAIATVTYKSKIWKWYVDDTLTILAKDYVDGFLQHLNSQQLTICFTMEIKKDNTILFSTRQFQGIQTVFSPPVFTSNSRNNNEDQNVPIAANQHATNSNM